MKSFYKIIIAMLILAMSSICSLYAQDLDGIEMGEKVSKEQLLKKYGQLKYFDEQDFTDEGSGILREMQLLTDRGQIGKMNDYF